MNTRIPFNCQENTVTIPVSQIAEFHHALCSLKAYIDQAPADAPLLWTGDNKTPVTQVIDYKYAEKAIIDTEILLDIVSDDRLIHFDSCGLSEETDRLLWEVLEKIRKRATKGPKPSL